ncbi:hypothetical protein G9A89_014618 [Geosiphon pyriformis]|nr:hypothetical protein G9A89_014618 [Geosiphon pyriformis]
MTDFGLTDDYHVHDNLNQGEVFSSLLWHIFYDSLLVCGYRLNSHFVSRRGHSESRAGLSFFFAAGAFVATQHIFNIASKFFWVNNISINNDKTVAIPINSRVSNPFLSISGLPISIAKKEESYCLAKVHSDIRFFVNLVLKKAVSDKQFLYLVLAVLQPIVSYHTQFSFVSIGICDKWNTLVCKGLKLKSGLLLDFPGDMLHYPSFYDLKSFSQVQFECKVAFLVSFINSGGILGCLFSHNFPVCINVSAFNNFLADMVRIFLDCNLSLGGSLANFFQPRGGVPMSAVLGESKFSKFLSSLHRFGVAFVNQLCDHHGAFKLATAFLNGVNSSPTGLLVLGGVDFLDILRSRDFVSVCDHLSHVSLDDISVYTDGSLKNLGTAGYRADATAFLRTLAIVLALECVSLSSSVCLFSDSQSALDACKAELGLVCPNFCNQCWIEHQHIVNIVRSRNLSVSWHKVKDHSGIFRNEHTDLIAGDAFLSD